MNDIYKLNLTHSTEVLALETTAEHLYQQGKYNELKALIEKFKDLLEIEDNKGAVFYDMGLLYSDLHSLNPNKDEKYLEKQLYCYRQAISFFENNKEYANNLAFLKLYTNYANNLRSVNRIVASCRYYRKALLIDPNFYMAIGNYGVCLHFLAPYANQKHGSNINIDRNAYEMVMKAYESNDDEVYFSGAREYWDEILSDLKSDKEYFDKVINTIVKYRCIEVEDEKHARWCLINHLLLDVETEIEKYDFSYLFDELYIPNISEDNKKMFDQLSQDYCYARDKIFFYHESLDEIRIQDIRSIFSLLYSVFDKCAFFINIYYNLGFEERRASAANVFKNQEFINLIQNNQVLNGIYYTYKEFEEKYGDSDRAFYRDFYDLRNGFEHRFVFLSDIETKIKIDTNEGNYLVSIKSLYNYTYELLLIVREIILYLYMSLINDDYTNHKSA